MAAGSAWCVVLLLIFSVTNSRLAYSQREPLQLELASVIFRHGDRSPVDSYPNDQYNESHWPQGFGQLSTVGMQQEYFLGTVLRQRYVVKCGLINSNYTRVQVYVRSTDYDRTLMSAQSQLAGLFPPDEDQRFNSSILWQPIPVHTVPQDKDMLLQTYNLDCPRYNTLREEDKQSDEYKNKEEENKDFFLRLEESTGLVPTTLSNVWTIQDTLLVQNLSGLPMPDWLEPGDFERMTELATYTLNLMFSSTEKNRLVAGNWVGKVVGDMMTKKETPDGDIKLYLYSAHDVTVAAMAAGLGVYNEIMPPYASALLIELYSDSNGEYWVSLFYRNETDSDTLCPLNVDSCSNTTLCTLEEFEKHTAAIIPDDWEKECGLTSDSDSGRGDSDSGRGVNKGAAVLGSLFAVTAVALAVVVVLLAVYFYRKWRRSRQDVNTFIEMENQEE